MHGAAPAERGSSFAAPSGLRPMWHPSRAESNEALPPSVGSSRSPRKPLGSEALGEANAACSCKALMEAHAPAELAEEVRQIADAVTGALDSRFQDLQITIAATVPPPMAVDAHVATQAPSLPSPTEVCDERGSAKLVLGGEAWHGACLADLPRSKSCSSDLEERLSVCSKGTIKTRIKSVCALAEKKVLRRSFVVNFRRLMELQKAFAIIHELIKSTAIAALTLVEVEDVWELGYSVLFVAILFMMYAFHAAHYDTFDISDYRNLVELLEDDNGILEGRSVDNPNRLLKALSLARSGRRRRAVLFIVFFGTICIVMWSLVFSQWTMELQLTGMWRGFLTGEFYATLLLVGTLMLTFHIVFEWLYWRETQCFMPLHNSGEPWDPRIHGIPRRFSWFGLPSMWFTSPEAYEDLSLWIQHCKGQLPRRGKANKIFPEEVALFSLDAMGACRLRKTLLHAKLYSVQKGSFLIKDGLEPLDASKDQQPQELGIDLMYFDSVSKEYLQAEEDYTAGQVHALRQSPSTLRSSLGDPLRIPLV
eukprot:TRINITY_DN23719_c0_g1_i1.p1 TRINITY_DN23719_c0_g1~~TRINITY_DN23719_c0_g1_i1.p1  ORF type:complete len:536 (+),score=100.98 TRINITY_DN23719_c0_g1_i1:59-1666(+)